MSKHTIVAQFHDYGAAHRAFCELLTSGVAPQDVSLIAGDRSNTSGADRDFGILADDAEFHIAAIRRGTTLLAVRANDDGGEDIARIIEAHAADFEDEDSGSAAEVEYRRSHWRH